MKVLYDNNGTVSGFIDVEGDRTVEFVYDLDPADERLQRINRTADKPFTVEGEAPFRRLLRDGVIVALEGGVAGAPDDGEVPAWSASTLRPEWSEGSGGSGASATPDILVIKGPNRAFNIVGYYDFDTVDPDGAGYTGGTSLSWDVATPNVVTVNRAGLYQVAGNGYFSAVTPAANEQIAVYVDRWDATESSLPPGYWTLASQRRGTLASGFESLAVTVLLQMAVGEGFALNAKSSAPTPGGTVSGNLVIIGPL